MWPTMLPISRVRFGSLSSRFSRRISRVRSRPARASLELRPDVDDADDRRYQKCEQRDKFHIFADGELTAQDLAGADVHDQRTPPYADHHSRG